MAFRSLRTERILAAVVSASMFEALRAEPRRYLMRAPVNLSRLRFDRDSGLVVYEPNKPLVHFYGAYADRVRSSFRNPDRRVSHATTRALQAMARAHLPESAAFNRSSKASEACSARAHGIT